MRTLILPILFSFAISMSYSQVVDTSAARLRTYEFPDSPRHNIDLKLGGPALGFSLNYERRFINDKNEFGIRTGFGIAPGDSVKSVLAVPLQGYCRLGKKKDRLEIGAGATYLHAVGISGSSYKLNSFTSVKIPANKNNILIATTSVGVRFPWFYKFHPEESGRTDEYVSLGAMTFYTFGQFGLVPYLSFGATF